jgi:DNA-binding CsgD family transcriptional regulator
MKTQFLVLLCGVLSPFLMATSAANTPLDPQPVSLLTTVNTAVLKAKPTSFFRNEADEDLMVSNTQLTAAENPNRTAALKGQKLEVSEFSYNNMVLPAPQKLNRVPAIEASRPSIDQSTIFTQGLFYGFTMMMVLANLFCFVLFRDKVFAFFSATMAALAAFLFVNDGLGGLFFVETHYNLLLEGTLMFLMLGAQTLFAYHYLLIKEKAPKLRGFTFILMAISALALIFFALSQNSIFGQIAQATMLTLMARYLYFAMTHFSSKGYVKLFAIASILPLVILIDQFALGTFGTTLLGSGNGALKLAAMTQGLLLTYGIITRMQTLKTDRELRQLEMRIFVERQDALSARIKTEKLVEDMYLENLIMQYDLDAIEIKLLQYISEGKTNQTIARKLKTTVEDIEDLTKDLYQKLEIGEQIQKDVDWSAQQPQDSCHS